MKKEGRGGEGESVAIGGGILARLRGMKEINKTKARDTLPGASRR
jgi:hypothetical protein